MMQGSSWIILLSGLAARALQATRGKRAARLAAILAVVAVACFPTTAAAQYKSARVDDRLRLDAIFAQGFIRQPTNNPADKQRFDAFFTQYYFPAMTRPEPEHLAELGTLRQDLFGRFLWQTQDEELQKDLTQKAFAAMLPIVKDPGYHPAVQYNAMLILGMLDKQYGVDVGGERRPPQPLPQANDILIRAALAAADGKIPPQLLVGALVGLQRHAKYYESLPPEALDGMTKASQKILGENKALSSVDADVAAWIKLQAASVLAELGAVGDGNKIHLALVQLVGDANMQLDDRCQAAALLKKMKYEGVKLDGKSTLDPLMKLTAEVAESERKRAKLFQDIQVGTGVVSERRNRIMARGYGDVEDQKFDRRPLLSKLVDLKRGLESVKGALPADEQPRIEALLAAIGPVITSANDDGTVDLKLVRDVYAMADQIQAVSKSGAAAPAGEASANAF